MGTRPCSRTWPPWWIRPAARGRGHLGRRTLEATGCDLLLDLHNLYANALNFGQDPRALLHALPAPRIAAVHIAGGRFGRRRWGPAPPARQSPPPVPPVVYELLTEVGALTPRPLSVILERDGAYPPFLELLEELDRARGALAAGRRRPSINGRTA